MGYRMKHGRPEKAKLGLRLARVLLAAGFLAGFLWFCLPLIYLHVQIGMLFGAGVCLCGFLLLTLGPRLAGHGRRKKVAVLLWVLSGLYVVFLGWIGFVAVKIDTAAAEDPPAGATVVVLGSRVYENGPSKSLRARLDTALAYLEANPGSACVVTGGQGEDEPRTEASVQAEYLMERGIDPERIFLEEKSTSTEENFVYSLEIFESHDLPKQVAVVTQGFHMFRSMRLAEAAGYEAYGLPAYTDPLMYPDYFGREIMAVTKYYLDTWLGGSRR